LDVYDVKKEKSLDSNLFQRVCPALIYQLEKKTCMKSSEKENHTTTLEKQSWRRK